jgi:hypothetical protein
VDPRLRLDRCGKVTSHQDSIPGPSSPRRVAIPTELPWPAQYFVIAWKVPWFNRNRQIIENLVVPFFTDHHLVLA